MESKIGMKVILLRQMLGNNVGAVGYVVEEYTDFDDKNKKGVSIVFSNGAIDGFSADEQRRFLQCLDVDPRYSMYEFNNVNQVWRDFKNNYWRFHE